MAEVLLYGLVGAERLFFDPAEVYENDVEPLMEPSEKGVEIEEWSTHAPTYHLPHPDHLLEWIGEWTADCGEVDEGWHDGYEKAAKSASIRAAAELLIAEIGAAMDYRMANKHLRSLLLTWDEAGEPLIDGKPLYVRNEHVGPTEGETDG